MEPLHEEPRDYYRFTPYGLRATLEASGFTLKALWPRGGWWSVVLGSFVNQALYDWVNPQIGGGARRRRKLGTLLIIPVCAAVQWLGYALDRVFRTTKYTLGYVIVAEAQA